jgi:hypothetical protein
VLPPSSDEDRKLEYLQLVLAQCWLIISYRKHLYHVGGYVVETRVIWRSISIRY